MKYQDKYNDGSQGKALRYPLDVRSSLVEQSPEVPPETAGRIQTLELPSHIKTS